MVRMRRLWLFDMPTDNAMNTRRLATQTAIWPLTDDIMVRSLAWWEHPYSTAVVTTASQEIMAIVYSRIVDNLTFTRYYPSHILIDPSNSGPTGKVFNPSFPVSFLLHITFLWVSRWYTVPFSPFVPMSLLLEQPKSIMDQLSMIKKVPASNLFTPVEDFPTYSRALLCFISKSNLTRLQGSSIPICRRAYFHDGPYAAIFKFTL